MHFDPHCCDEKQSVVKREYSTCVNKRFKQTEQFSMVPEVARLLLGNSLGNYFIILKDFVFSMLISRTPLPLGFSQF